MINLLPPATIRSLRRTYYVRLMTAGLFLLSLVGIVGIALLVPTYVVSERAADASEQYLSAFEETVGIKERSGVAEEARALRETINILSALEKELRITSFFENAPLNESSEISITGIDIVRGESSLNVSFTGVAETRNALLAFTEALRQRAEFDGVEVPVSQLALEVAIPFSITARYHRDTP